MLQSTNIQIITVGTVVCMSYLCIMSNSHHVRNDVLATLYSFSTDLKRNIYKTSNGLDISIYYKHQKIFIYFFVFKTMFLKHAIFGILLHYKTSKV